MKTAKKHVELPMLAPLYGTYQYQGQATAVLSQNPSILNWYFNNIFILSCNRRFLNGFTSPEIDVVDSDWHDCPYLEKVCYDTRFLDGCFDKIVKNILKDGYYVFFDGVDDYYVKGKSWYKERHIKHDGMLFGFDEDKKTYDIFSYDSDWVYRKYKTTQRSFYNGVTGLLKSGENSAFFAVKPMNDIIEFEPKTVMLKMKEYLDSTIERYPENENGTVFGIAVHDYLVKYIEMLYDASIPFWKMDRRVMRLIWEHKNVMLKRIRLLEETLGLDCSIGDNYEKLVTEADRARLLYASYHMRRRDALLPMIRNGLIEIKNREEELLNELIRKVGKI